MKLKRTSFDLTESNSTQLKKFSKKAKVPFSTVINDMLHLFLGMDWDIRKEFMNLCKKKIDELKDRASKTTGFEKQNIITKATKYKQIYDFFVASGDEEIEAVEGMTKIQLKNGYLLVPSDWIILDNLSNPEDCMYAGVVETQNPIDGSRVYANKHYVFFSDYKCGRDYPRDFEEAVLKAALDKDPSFAEIYNDRFVFRYNDDGTLINKSEFASKPVPGLFAIVEYKDPDYWNEFFPDYEPPYGAMIVRDI